MLQFDAQDEIEIYAGITGLICFSGKNHFDEEARVVALTIGQFRKVIKNAEQLIDDAEENKVEWEKVRNDEANS